jgi:hypothetical protein
MDTISTQLLDLAGTLQPVAGTAQGDLAELRLFLAATLIQANPGVVVSPDPAMGPELAAALAKGAEFATELTAAGTRLRFLRVNELGPVSPAEKPAHVFGPFLDSAGDLERFLILQSEAFFFVHERQPSQNPSPEVLLLLPSSAVAEAGNLAFDIPAGTVWIRSRLLVANAAGYAGLRVARGRLTFAAAASVFDKGVVLLAANGLWKLELEPEQPPAGEAAGTDANGTSVVLPQTLEVSSDGHVAVSGTIGISGFGSGIVFAAPGGPPSANAFSMDFPFDPAGQTWSIAGNRSAAAQIEAECSVTSAVWSIPVQNAAPVTFGEAAHGGSLVVSLKGPVSLQPAGMSGGRFRFSTTVLSASASRLQIDGGPANAQGRFELKLWGPAISRIAFEQAQPVASVLFLSERDLGDLASILNGGIIRNRWDLPLRATGSPFEFEGTLAATAVLARPAGLRMVCAASRDAGFSPEGLVLENLFLTVRPPSRLMLQGSYDGVSAVADGAAFLWFDVVLAQPMFPDPYATNWSVPTADTARPAALSTILSWADSATPAIIARLEQTVLFPEPADVRLDDNRPLRNAFDDHLQSRHESLSLLDLSSNDHLFGVSIEPMSHLDPKLADNQLSVRLRDLRLLMQPQVLWEPVQVAGTPLNSIANGGRTLAGTTSVKLVPIRPSIIAREWASAAQQRIPWAALFALPFGIQAFARLLRGDLSPFTIPAIDAGLHAVDFAPALSTAPQIRLIATDGVPPKLRTNLARSMTGTIDQTDNLQTPNTQGLKNVLDVKPLKDELKSLDGILPLHQVDLSGYGLSAFSDWRKDDPTGVSQVRFDVMNGRTSLEVIQIRTILAPCRSHLVQTIIMERKNSGSVLRFDSGLVAVDDGHFDGGAKFDKGVVIAFRNIRHIRVLKTPSLKPGPPGPVFEWLQVLYDCDVQLENPISAGANGLVTVYDQSGYVQISPAGTEYGGPALAALFAATKQPMGGASSGAIRIAGTLDMQLSAIFADLTPKFDGDLASGFAIAAYGSPQLPRAGQWSAVKISSAGEAFPVDPRHGIPVVRLDGEAYKFRDAADARREPPSAEYGLLMATPASRVLFPRPTLSPNAPGVLHTEAPSMADPLSLAQATGVFPRAAYAIQAMQAADFDISAANAWRLTQGGFPFTAPAKDLAKGGEWTMNRGFDGRVPPMVPPVLTTVIDSANEANPWGLGVTPNDLSLDIDPFPDLFTITSNYQAAGDALAKLQKPSLIFGAALKELKDIINALSLLTGLGLEIHVDVALGSGPSPSFIITIDLSFLLGEGPNERFDIGIGKFYGEFQIHGKLEAALSGSTTGHLLAEFQGDIQQGILPPLLYAGGLFRFALEISESGKPTIELGLGITTSLGGDLIPGLVAVEATISYGYTLIPQKLQPGVLLGLEARAKLLGGLVGFSFSVQAMARIQRIDAAKGNVTIFADIRVVATAQIAWLIDEDVDVRTQFEQNIPLGLAVAIAGGPGALVVVSSATSL